jgi:hypothetical protein
MVDVEAGSSLGHSVSVPHGCRVLNDGILPTWWNWGRDHVWRVDRVGRLDRFGWPRG